mgnify:CR=1 FL=1
MGLFQVNEKAVMMTAFSGFSKKFLIVFYDGIIFPDIHYRKENDLFFQKNTLDAYAMHIPSG